MFQAINPEDVVKPISNYSNGLAAPAGRMLFVSGQVGATADLNIPQDVEGQARVAFENFQKIVEAAGGSMKDIVSVTLYLCDISDSPLVSHLRSEYFSHSPFPTSTTIGNCTFVLPQLRFEVSAIAVLSD